MTDIVLQQLFCFMTHNIKHIQGWFGLPWLTLCLATLTLELLYFWFAIWFTMYFASLICFTWVFQSTSPYWCFSQPNTMWIFVTITLGHFPLILLTLWCYIQLTWQFLLTQPQSTFLTTLLMDHHPSMTCHCFPILTEISYWLRLMYFDPKTLPTGIFIILCTIAHETKTCYRFCRPVPNLIKTIL